jgi:hypothetical protein
MGHWLWFGIAEQRNVPIRALLRFGNVKLKNVKVASGAGRWFRGRFVANEGFFPRWEMG